jgi:hypothetical protein
MEMHMLFHPDAAHRVLAGWPANYRKENVFYSEIRSAPEQEKARHRYAWFPFGGVPGRVSDSTSQCWNR